MFGMGVQEIVIIAIVLIIVVGPDDLPGLLRTVGRWIGNIQVWRAIFAVRLIRWLMMQASQRSGNYSIRPAI